MAFEPIVRLTMYAVGLDGGLYVCNPFSLEVDLLLQNNSESCKEIKRLPEFKGGIAFTDSGDQKVKFFRPSEINIKILMGRKEQVMERMKHVLLRKFVASVLWRRLH